MMKKDDSQERPNDQQLQQSGKPSSQLDTIDDLVGGPKIQDDRGEQQQERRPENKVVQIREQTPTFRIMTWGFRRH
jgi:hypothetical protein